MLQQNIIEGVVMWENISKINFNFDNLFITYLSSFGYLFGLLLIRGDKSNRHNLDLLGRIEL